ncbi:unnamed protein product [Caenorhabditis nigoni]
MVGIVNLARIGRMTIQVSGIRTDKRTFKALQDGSGPLGSKRWQDVTDSNWWEQIQGKWIWKTVFKDPQDLNSDVRNMGKKQVQGIQGHQGWLARIGRFLIQSTGIWEAEIEGQTTSRMVGKDWNDFNSGIWTRRTPIFASNQYQDQFWIYQNRFLPSQ